MHSPVRQLNILNCNRFLRQRYWAYILFIYVVIKANLCYGNICIPYFPNVKSCASLEVKWLTHLKINIIPFLCLICFNKNMPDEAQLQSLFLWKSQNYEAQTHVCWKALANTGLKFVWKLLMTMKICRLQACIWRKYASLSIRLLIFNMVESLSTLNSHQGLKA